MYQGSDLTTLMTTLDALCADNFFQYSLNVGQANPHLTITISNYWQTQFPAIAILAAIQPMLSVYSTTNFSLPVADFITALQAGCHAYANARYSAWNAYYTHAVTFSAFLTALVSKE